MLDYIENSQQTALIIDEAAISFSQLHDFVSKQKKIFKPLEKKLAVITASPCLHFISLMLGALAENIPVAILPENLTASDKKQYLDCLGSYVEFDFQGNKIDEKHANDKLPHPKVALVLFTSGSTGKVKAVQLSQENILANCFAIINAMKFDRIKSQLLFLPLSYSFGLLGQLLPGLICGLSTTIISSFTDVLTIFERGNIPEMWSGVPSHWQAIGQIAQHFNEHADHIKTIVSAGAVLALPLRESMRKLFPKAIIYNNYGLTEASPRVLIYSSEDPLFLANYVGYPIGDWQVKINSKGVLYIKGKQVMLGYLGDDNTHDIDGWLPTGDRAEILPSGLVAISGRADEMIKMAGEKVSIAVLENKLRLLPQIDDVVIIPQKDALYGIVLKAFVELNKEQRKHSGHKLQTLARALFLPKRYPLNIEVKKTLPRCGNGKINRKLLQQHVASLEYDSVS
jgi:long-chain acyl-CoA synthetase